jgi:hypothetical protein
MLHTQKKEKKKTGSSRSSSDYVTTLSVSEHKQRSNMLQFSTTSRFKLKTNFSSSSFSLSMLLCPRGFRLLYLPLKSPLTVTFTIYDRQIDFRILFVSWRGCYNTHDSFIPILKSSHSSSSSYLRRLIKLNW